MADVPVFQQKEVLVGAVLLSLFLYWWHCRTNPPGETCLKPDEPIYPPPIYPPHFPLTPLDPPLTPLSPPVNRRCLDFPGKNTPPFPCCYTRVESSIHDFPQVNAGNYTFIPSVHQLKGGKGMTNQVWELFGWFARSKTEEGCDQISDDPSFGGRFHLVQNTDECGGIYGCP